MKTFSQWFEAIVATKNINRAIQESIELIVGGSWQTQLKDFQTFTKGSVGATIQYQRSLVQMTGETDKGLFYLAAYPEVNNQVQDYDSKAGNDSIGIEAYLWGRTDTDRSNIGNFKKIAEGKFKTPLDLARWVRENISDFRDEDDGGGGWEDAPIDPNLEPVLVPVQSRGR